MTTLPAARDDAGDLQALLQSWADEGNDSYLQEDLHCAAMEELVSTELQLACASTSAVPPSLRPEAAAQVPHWMPQQQLEQWCTAALPDLLCAAGGCAREGAEQQSLAASASSTALQASDLHPLLLAAPGTLALPLLWDPVGCAAGGAAVAGQQCAPPAPAAAGGSSNPSPRRQRPRLFGKHACQADGCTADLAPLAYRMRRHHICPVHLKAGSYMVRGTAVRFCQSCYMAHPLAQFEGAKRCCRRSLQRRKQLRAPHSSADASSTTSGQPACAEALSPLHAAAPVVMQAAGSPLLAAVQAPQQPLQLAPLASPSAARAQLALFPLLQLRPPEMLQARLPDSGSTGFLLSPT